MFNPADLTLAGVSSILRDLTVVGVLLRVAWKIRGVWEGAKNFFIRLTTHMDVMEGGMQTLLANHLTHIEKELRALNGKKSDI